MVAFGAPERDHGVPTGHALHGGEQGTGALLLHDGGGFRCDPAVRCPSLTATTLPVLPLRRGDDAVLASREKGCGDRSLRPRLHRRRALSAEASASRTVAPYAITETSEPVRTTSATPIGIVNRPFRNFLLDRAVHADRLEEDHRIGILDGGGGGDPSPRMASPEPPL